MQAAASSRLFPTKARTFGMDALFRQIGIYSPKGQLYEPVDRETLLYYQEAKDGQILRRGNHGSGFDVFLHCGGDGVCKLRTEHDSLLHLLFHVWLSTRRRFDVARGRYPRQRISSRRDGGRTTLNGEGLQHQDGHGHLVAGTIPTLLAYDPAFTYELAVIIREGMRRMYENNEEIFYYITLYNENYQMPEMPAGVEEGILKGLYKFKTGADGKNIRSRFWQRTDFKRSFARAADPCGQIQCLGRRVERYKLQVASSRRAQCKTLEHAAPDGNAKEILRRNRGRQSKGAVHCVSDNVKLIPEQIAQWIPGRVLTVLGTDGFGP